MIGPIFDILLSQWKTGVLTTAVQLRVFTILSDQKLTLEEIGSNCGAVPNYLKPLLDACAAWGILTKDADQYMNSYFARAYFVEGQRLYVGDFLDLVNVESKEWQKLPDIIRGKKDMRQRRPYVRSDYQTFIKAMNNIGNLGEAEALKNSVDLSECREMIDVGGGSGLYSIALCHKYPQLHATILDVRDTLTITKKLIENFEEKSQISLKEADFLKDSFGENMDVVLLSDVVYGESKAGVVLRSAWNCLKPKGYLVIRGYYADPEQFNPLFGALFAVKELVDNASRKILTLSALEKIVKQKGFTISKIGRMSKFSSIIIGQKL